VDAGVAVGDEVTGRFDPMLAKIVAHGRNRGQALDRLADALGETVVLGLVTNLRFLRQIVRHPLVRAGEVRIDSLERIWEPSLPGQVPDALVTEATKRLLESMPASPWTAGWRLNAPPTVRLEVDGDASGVGDTVYVDDDGRSRAVRLARPPDVERAAQAATHAGSSAVSSPMPGRVLAVHVADGAIVERGDPIATLEAMKMEHVVAAPSPGRVADLTIGPGDQVMRDQVLARIEQGAGTL
jgi:acetyl/propionyl-CoA carboxylase alpha subunit